MTPERIEHYVDMINHEQNMYDMCYIDGHEWRERVASILTDMLAESKDERA